MKFELLPDDYDPYKLPEDWPISQYGVKMFTISTSAPYVTRWPKQSVSVVRRLYQAFPGPMGRDLRVLHTRRGYRVKCSACGWSGYRNGLQCECYDSWSYYCRPWVPGPGCPNGILWPCPKCNGHGNDWKQDE